MRRSVTAIALSTLVAGSGLAAVAPAHAAPADPATAGSAAPAAPAAVTPPAPTQFTYRAAGSHGFNVPTGAGTVPNVFVGGLADSFLEISAGTGLSVWSIMLTPATGSTLTAGTYTGVGRSATASSPGLDVSYDGSGCGNATSDVRIYQIATDATGAVTSLEVGFDFTCGSVASGDFPVHGLIRYNATGDLPAGEPTGQAPSAPVGTTGPMAFVRDGAVILNPGNGTGGTNVGDETLQGASGSGYGAVAWTPGLNRVVFTHNQLLHSFLLDGSGDIPLTGGTSMDVDPAIAPDGTVAFVRGGEIFLAGLDGSSAGGEYLLVTPDSLAFLNHPAWSPDGSLLFDSTTSSSSDIYRWSRGSKTLFIANAEQPVPSPDGTRIAFVRADADGVKQLFTAAADGVSDLIQVTHEETDVTTPSWSPDGQTLAYSMRQWNEVLEIPAGGGDYVGSVPDAAAPSWKPAQPATNHVTRIAGASRIDTAIAASRHDFADHGAADPARDQAGAVVLARSDNYADALGGSSLAVRKNAPLLITDPKTLDPQISDEIQRVLAPGGTVYVLGGTGAMSPAVASAVQALGYHVARLAGADRYATSVAIAKVVDPSPNPHDVLIATGDNFPDALAAGATGLPLVLTSGTAMPKATAAYLNTLSPIVVQNGVVTQGLTYMITIGGPGDQALINGYLAGQMPSWPSLITRWPVKGDTREGTALLVAQGFFGGYSEAAFATSVGWPDALSGGAMIGHLGGPLLLTDPGSLFGPAGDYVAAEAQTGSLQNVDVLGGPGALPPAIAEQIAASLGDPSHVVVDAKPAVTDGAPAGVPGVPLSR